MFKWLKNKLNHFIPKDINNGFMSYTVCDIKVNSQIEVPENVVCFVCFNNKIYATFEAGTHTFTEETLSSLFNKQRRKITSSKKFKAYLLFVNTSSFEIITTHKQKLFIDEKRTKTTITLTSKMCVRNPKLFCDSILCLYPYVDAYESREFVQDYIKELLYGFFTKRTINSTHLATETREKFDEKYLNHLKKLGLENVNYSLSINDSKVKSTKNESFDFFGQMIEDSTKQMDITSTTPQQDDTLEQENCQNDTCQNCGAKIINGAEYCLKCGKKL